MEIDHEAIHRNEVTGEMEGQYEFISKHRKVIDGVINTFNTHRVVHGDGASVVSWTSRVEHDESKSNSIESCPCIDSPAASPPALDLES